MSQKKAENLNFSEKKMDDGQHPNRVDWSLTTWEGSRCDLIEHWSRMSLDEILDAQEEMAELSSEMTSSALCED